MKFNHIELGKEVPSLKQLNEDGTRYYVTPEGNKYPSVTTILSSHNKKAIMEWRNRVGHEKAQKITTQASVRGTRFHKLCEDYLNNEDIEFKTPLEQEVFNEFKPILHNIDNIYAQELRMYSDHLRAAGTVDCVGEYQGHLAIIDFKTSSKPKKEEWIENYFMQCAAYAVMFEERFDIPVNNLVVLISVNDNKPQIFVKKRDEYIEKFLEYRDLNEEKA